MTKQFKRILGVLSVFLLGLVLIGCTVDQEGGTSEPADNGSEDTELSIGFSISTLNNPFFVSMAEGAEAKAAELGISINVVDAGNDPAKQSTDIEDLINTGINVLIINPEDSASVGPAVQSALDKGIKVIAIDREVEGADIDVFIGTNNVAAAEAAGEELLNYLDSDDEVVILEGVPGASSAIDRNEGFLNALEGNVNIVASQTANFDRTEALTVTENLLQAHPNIRAIVAANDEMALGAIEAVNGANKTPGEDILITGFDANDDAVTAVGAGTMLMTVEQQPDLMGGIGVETALKLFNGESVDSEIPADVTVLDAEILESRN